MAADIHSSTKGASPVLRLSKPRPMRSRLHMAMDSPSSRGRPGSPARARNLAQKAHWEARTPHYVQVHHRPMRYLKLQQWRDQGRIDPRSGREKGIDVAAPLDVVDASRTADLVVLASVDTDLVPALEDAKRVGSARIETTSWFHANIEGGRWQLRTTPASWNTRLGEPTFRGAIDQSDYA